MLDSQLLSIVAYCDRTPQGKELWRIARRIMDICWKAIELPPVTLLVSGDGRITEYPGASAESVRAIPADVIKDAVSISATGERRRGQRKGYTPWSFDVREWMFNRVHDKDRPCYFVLQIGRSSFKTRDDREASGRIFDRWVKTFASYEPCRSAWAEFTDAAEINNSWLYTDLDTRIGWYPWHRQVNHRLWHSNHFDRDTHVRGVYWGNYLGPKVAEKFDPDGSVTRRYLESAAKIGAKGIEPAKARRFVGGGLYLTLTDIPLTQMSDVYDYRVPNDIAVDRANILRRLFIERGVLA